MKDWQTLKEPLSQSCLEIHMIANVFATPGTRESAGMSYFFKEHVPISWDMRKWRFLCKLLTVDPYTPAAVAPTGAAAAATPCRFLSLELAKTNSYTQFFSKSDHFSGKPRPSLSFSVFLSLSLSGSIPRSGRPPGCKNNYFPKPLLHWFFNLIQSFSVIRSYF